MEKKYSSQRRNSKGKGGSIVVGVTGAVLSLVFPEIFVGDFSWSLILRFCLRQYFF